ncbi:MAG TPA: hypothetical protein VJS37_19290, partial [Terriglobales bacterium]|nr:hypothetical protein [Terriglobales bacterium]
INARSKTYRGRIAEVDRGSVRCAFCRLVFRVGERIASGLQSRLPSTIRRETQMLGYSLRYAAGWILHLGSDNTFA